MRPLPLLLAAALAAACGASTPVPQAQPQSHPRSAVAGRPAITWHGGADRPAKVLVVVEENHAQRSALSGMPYLASMAKTYGQTTAYRAVTHPSLPNYLGMVGGSTFGVRDDRNPAAHPVAGPSVFDLALANGRTAKTYAEAMPSSCALTPTSPYAVKHNPWAYFSDATSRSNCRRFDVPSGTPASGALRADVDRGTLPNIGMLIPDLCHDGHDCSLATADSWLKGWLQTVMAGPDYRGGRLAIVVTFDEDDNSGDNTVLTTVISPYTRGVRSTAAYTHYSLTRYLAELVGTRPPRSGAAAPSMRAAFHL
ncbi:MAG: alkaline phosphatase family protein [Actinobacteria bacterium]|nr:alkaline phosphatase family protein [Actinomycetota bacterium]MCA1720554.1 alkaline phosphatase family protein [Actinomycetota bacterium]